tara:strand:- start:225 stop:572 length:348 start_codon:yes stop_codon:yes gene_type:complete
MDLTPAELEDAMYHYARESVKLGKIYVKYQKDFNNLEDRKHDYLAKLSLLQDGKSVAEKERMARVTTEWGTFREGTTFAKNKALESRIAYEESRRLWETYRSLLSHMNARMRTNI